MKCLYFQGEILTPYGLLKTIKTNFLNFSDFCKGFDEMSMCFTQIHWISSFRDRNSDDFSDFVVVFEQL